MKKVSIWLIGTLLFITSCAPSINEDEVVQENEETREETSIVPSYQLSEENYKMILPFKPSAARGVITDQLGNRVDIDEVEEGLRRHSKAEFDPEKYFYQEGQYLTEDMVIDWIDGLNPVVEDDEEEEVYRENPRYLSHVLEQNYLRKKEDNTVELVGISIGIAMKSVYRFQTEPGGPYYYEDISQREMMEQANEMAQTMLERVRQMDELNGVPIMFAIYREADQGSPIPGNFVAKTNIAGSDMSLNDWETIDEEYVLFPSDEAEEKYYDDSQLINSFGNEIAQYFPNYVGSIGEGFYVNDDLKKLTIEVPLEFYGKGEVVGFTQYAYGVLKEIFPNYYDLEVKIMSDEKMESLIYREAGAEDPTVHIFH
ncbi:CamS family sex pheromone protein [Virgibacillus byunsanensis]|uniref:CamS family sex pheromone protein n=1 Tax=Virgibacillus byunsanensis TaxID=570945 RepID=A0ABW3LHZ4_9BACI